MWCASFTVNKTETDDNVLTETDIDVVVTSIRIGDIIRVPERNDTLAKIIGIESMQSGRRGHPRINRYTLKLFLSSEEKIECVVGAHDSITIVV